MKRFALITATLMSILGFVGAQTTFRPECAPRGIHFRGSDVPSCDCDASDNVICQSFTVCGVGNSNAVAELVSTFSATVQCTNPGGRVVEAQAEGVDAEAQTDEVEPKNGCLIVPGVRTDRPSATAFENEAECPNTSWTKMLLTATVVVDTSTYTLTFAGFTCPYIEITNICSA